jgi:hypothetical protein|tara:strand:+ start:49 stop:276 length:228 start_codon:yes stop_codon:yes gene_type:complete
MNVPNAGETSKEYFQRQERHFTSQAAALSAGSDSSSDDELTDKQRDKKDKKKNTALKKKARELADKAFKEATDTA